MGDVLPILLLVPLVWLVAGFLIHSFGGDAPVGDTPPSLSGYRKDAAAWLFIAILWFYLLVDEWRAPEPSWFWVGVLGLSVAAALYKVFRSLIEARQIAGQRPSSPQM